MREQPVEVVNHETAMLMEAVTSGGISRTECGVRWVFQVGVPRYSTGRCVTCESVVTEGQMTAWTLP